MGFRFIGQPFPGAEQLGYVISAALQDEAHNRAWIATAWAKRSGLGRLAKDIERFRARGGRIEAIVGVDEGGATIEGLRLATQLFDDPLVFHDPGVRTFHPKIYAVQNDEQAIVIVGSGNLTRGGLYTNYEGSIAGELDLTSSDDRSCLESVRAYFDRIAALTDFCKPLNDQAIQDLIDDPSVVMVSESQAGKQRQSRRGRNRSTMFGDGKAVPDLLGAPPPSADLTPEEDEADDAVAGDVPDAGDEATPHGEGAGPSVGGPGQPGIVPILGARPELVWSKQMTASDAHRKPPTSHQRNYVALSQAGHNIDWTTWFREELFGSLPWSQEPMRTGNLKDVTVVPFEVFIEDRHLGQYNLLVDHYEGRIADQRNAPTYLNWSSMLSVIQADDYEGWWLELARLPDGAYLLRLLRDEPGY